MDKKEKRIKVLFVVPTPPPYTGLEVMSEFFLEAALKNEFQIIHLRSNLNNSNKMRGKVRISNLYRFMLLCVRLSFILSGNRSQIVYTILSENMTGFLRSYVIIVIGKILRKKIVVHLYGSNFMNFYKHSNMVIKNMIKYVLRHTDRAIVLGDILKNQFDGIYNPEKIRVVYNAVPPERFILPKDRLGKKNEGVQILFIGLLSQAKGFNDIMKSIPLVLERCPTAKFVFAGERIKVERNILFDFYGKKILFENIEEFLGKLREKYFTNIQFIGSIKEEEKEKLFIQSDIFVLPSYSEGFPIAILEAMGFGLPIITTPVGAIPELLKDAINCFFVPVNDYKTLAGRIIYLIDNPSMRLQMGQNNYFYIKNSLNINRSAEIMSGIFKEVSLKYMRNN